ncbi:MAG: diguanylate cyclase [Thermomicrobiales bacterium]
MALVTRWPHWSGLLFVFGGIAAVSALVIPRGTTDRAVGDLVFLCTSALAAILCLRTAGRMPESAVPWRWFGAGCLLWFGGHVIWTVNDLSTDRVPYPSLADVGYLALYPCFFVGLILIVRGRRGVLPTVEVVIDSLLAVVVAAALGYRYLLRPLFDQADRDTAALVASLIWQVATFALVILTVVALVWHIDLPDRRSLAALLGGLVLFGVSSLIYGRLAYAGTYQTGDAIDLGWNGGFLLFALAAFLAGEHGSQAETAPLVSAPRVRLLWRAGAIVLSILAFTGLSVAAAVAPRVDRFTAAAAGLVGLLLAARLLLAVVHAERLVRRTRERDRLAAVVATSTAITGTLDVDQVLERLAAAAAAAVGRDRAEVTVLDENGRVERLAGHGLSDAERVVLHGHGAGQLAAVWLGDEHRPAIRRWPDESTVLPEANAAFRVARKRLSLIAPLLAHGQVVGYLDLWSPGGEQPFETEDLIAAAAIGQQGGLALHNARLLAETRRHADDRALLLRVSRAATSTLALPPVLIEIARAGLAIPDAECCGIELWRPDTDELEVVAEETVADWPGVAPVGARYPLSAWAGDRAVVVDRQTRLSRLADPDLSEQERIDMEREGIRSLLRVPLLVGPECIGIFVLYSRRLDAFDASARRLAEDVAAQTALAIANARLLEETQLRAEEQAALLRVNQAVISNLELRAVLREISRATIGVAGAECSEIELWRPESDETEIMAQAWAADWQAADLTGRRFPIDDPSATHHVLTSGEPLAFDPAASFLNERERGVYSLYSTQSVLLVPILIAGTSLGTLNLYSRQPQAFPPRAVRLGQDLANQAALAIERARLHDALAEQARTDGLTSLLNHRAILADLDEALARTRRAGTPVAVLMIDLDNFKRVNDTHGHLTGDGILRHASTMMRECLRGRGRLGRYGGDEFLIVLPGDDGPDAVEVAGQILACAAKRSAPVAGEDGAFPLRLSIGVAAAPDDGLTSQDLVAVADRAMYAAKAAGGGIVVAQPPAKAELVER